VKGRYERRLAPLLLTEKDLKQIPELISLYKQAVSKKWTKEQLEQKTAKFEKVFPGRKFAAVKKTLTDFFSFREQSFDDLLPNKTIQHLAKKGITSVFTLKLYFYDQLSKTNGYLPLDKREAFLNEQAEALLLPSVKLLENLLLLDIEEKQLLEKSFEPPLETRVVQRNYHKHILGTILHNAIKVKIAKTGHTGAFVKEAVRFCKKFLLEFDFIILDKENERKNSAMPFDEINAVQLEVEGPREVGGSAKDYSWSLEKFLEEMIVRFPEISVETIVRINQKHCFYQYEKEEILLLAQDFSSSSLSAKRKKKGIDSEVEQRFQRYFAMNEKGWQISVEPKPIIFQGSDKKRYIIIPDFEITRNKDERFLLEIIGYYRESYIAKKLKKLWMLKEQTDKTMMLLINSKIANRFEKLANYYPIFTYDAKKIFPIDEILSYLEKNISSFDERKKELLKTRADLQKKIANSLQEKPYLLLENLRQLLSVYSDQEVIEIVRTKDLKPLWQEHSLVWISNVGFVASELLASLRKKLVTLLKTKESSLNTIKEKIALPEKLYDKLIPIISHLGGFEIRWETLTPIVRLIDS
jgi:predicted nuclease of restriction endonuclease-like RecB superfamily